MSPEITARQKITAAAQLLCRTQGHSLLSAYALTDTMNAVEIGQLAELASKDNEINLTGSQVETVLNLHADRLAEEKRKAASGKPAEIETVDVPETDFGNIRKAESGQPPVTEIEIADQKAVIDSP